MLLLGYARSFWLSHNEAATAAHDSHDTTTTDLDSNTSIWGATASFSVNDCAILGEHVGGYLYISGQGSKLVMRYRLAGYMDDLSGLDLESC